MQCTLMSVFCYGQHTVVVQWLWHLTADQIQAWLPHRNRDETVGGHVLCDVSAH